MPLSHLEHLFHLPLVCVYKKGQTILRPGEDFTYVYYVRRGYVKVYSITEQGDTRTMLIFKPHTAFPILPLSIQADDHEINFFYDAMTDVELYRIPKEQLYDLLEQDSTAPRVLLDYTLDLSASLMKRMSIIEGKDARMRFCMLLQYLMHACGTETRPGFVRLNLKITHQDFADMAGTTRETASLQIKQLENEQVLSRTKNGLVVNTEKLEALK